MFCRFVIQLVGSKANFLCSIIQGCYACTCLSDVLRVLSFLAFVW